MVVDPNSFADDENPEWTDGDFARAKPFKDVFPEAFASWKRERERVTAEGHKMQVGLAADLVEAIKATGEGYTARVEKVLRAALARGEL